MALGNENGKRYDPSYFSRLSITDQETKNRLGFRFASGMLVFTISKLKDPTTFEYETLNEIFITPTKAKILTELLNQYDLPLEMQPEAVGITSGLKETVSAIAINPTSVTIGKVNSSGDWISESVVKFNQNYHFGIKWADVKKNEFDKFYPEGIELEQIRDLLENFAYNMPGAIAYSVADLARFDTSRQAGRLKPIYEKLGIEWGSGSNGGRGTGNNFFNNNTRNEGSGTAEHRDLDDVIDELPFD